MGIGAHCVISLKIVPESLKIYSPLAQQKQSALSVMFHDETTRSHLVKLFGKGNLVYRWHCVLRFHGQQWLIWATSFGIVQKYLSCFTIWN